MISYLLLIIHNALKLCRHYLKLPTFKPDPKEWSVSMTLYINLSLSTSHLISLPLLLLRRDAMVTRKDYKTYKTTRWYIDVVLNLSEIYC